MNIFLIGGSSIIGQDIHNYFTHKGINIISTYCNNKIDGMIKFDLKSDKFVNLINPHLPSRIQQSLRRVAGDKISLDRIRYEISSQQLLKGLRRSSMVGKSMQSHE